jgi:hypothetical protein
VGIVNNVLVGIVMAALGFRAWQVRKTAADTGVAPETSAS